MRKMTILSISSFFVTALLTFGLTTTTAQADEATEKKALMKENFKQADADGDGSLTPEEFKTFVDANADDDLGRAGKVRRMGAYDKAFKKMDKDEDGAVSWSEIVEKVKN